MGSLATLLILAARRAQGDLQVAVVVYAVNAALAGLTLTWLWRYASRDPRLLDGSKLDAREIRYNELRDLAVPALFLASIPLSFASAPAAELSWLLIFLVRPLLVRALWRRPPG